MGSIGEKESLIILDYSIFINMYPHKACLVESYRLISYGVTNPNIVAFVAFDLQLYDPGNHSVVHQWHTCMTPDTISL